MENAHTHPHSLNVDLDNSADWQDLLEEATSSTPLKSDVGGQASYTPPGIEEETSSEEEAPPISQKLAFLSRVLLVLVAFLYGTLNVIFRWVYSLEGPPSASAMSTARGWLAALCFLPFLAIPRQRNNESGEEESARTTPPSSHQKPPLWMIGTELGFWNFAAQGLINVGLLHTTAARASFLTQCSVVMTPLISAVTGTKVRCNVWAACVCALIGLSVLSAAHPSGGGEEAEEKTKPGFGIGDILVLTGALSWSYYIFRLSAVGDVYPEVPLQALKTTVLAGFYTCWFLIAQLMASESLWPGWKNPEAWMLLFYSALGPGAVADILQQKGQAVVAAAESNVIISMEPVFTSILGWILLGEVTTGLEQVGGGLIILAAIIATRE